MTQGNAGMRPTVSVSYPRSGHHLLEDLLELTTVDFSYCEFYNPTDCCRQVPCTRPGRDLQKHHDTDGDLPVLVDQRYIVQFRTPLGSFTSDYRLHLRATGTHDSVPVWRAFVADSVRRWRRFMTKWALPGESPTRCLVRYEDLLAAPAETTKRVRAFMGAQDRELDNAMDALLADRFVSAARPVEPFHDGDAFLFLAVERALASIMNEAGLAPVTDAAGGWDAPATADDVDAVFRALLHRAAEPEHVDSLIAQALSRDQVWKLTLESDEFRSLEADHAARPGRR